MNPGRNLPRKYWATSGLRFYSRKIGGRFCREISRSRPSVARTTEAWWYSERWKLRQYRRDHCWQRFVGASLFSCRQLAQRFHVVTVAHSFDLAGLFVDYNTVRQLDVQADDGEVLLAPVLLPLVRPDPIRPTPREVTRAALVWLPIHVGQQVAPQMFRSAHLFRELKLRLKSGRNLEVSRNDNEGPSLRRKLLQRTVRILLECILVVQEGTRAGVGQLKANP